MNEAQHKALTTRMDRIEALLERILGHAEYMAQRITPPSEPVQSPSAFSGDEAPPVTSPPLGISPGAQPIQPPGKRTMARKGKAA